MDIKTVDTAQQEDILLINKLTRMLEEQINIMQCSDVSGRKVEAFAEQIQSIVDEIASKGLLDMKQFKEHREQIKRLYNNLNIAIITRKKETEKQMNHIHKGRKTIIAYRNNS